MSMQQRVADAERRARELPARERGDVDLSKLTAEDLEVCHAYEARLIAIGAVALPDEPPVVQFRGSNSGEGTLV